MLRLSGLSLPLDHEADALPAAIAARLGVLADALRGFTIYRRGNDARKRTAIELVNSGAIDLDALVTQRFPLDAVESALNADRIPGNLKSVVDVGASRRREGER